MSAPRHIDWSKASELGLVERINKEILHPLGLAMTRNAITGSSDSILIADAGVWEYSDCIPDGPIYNQSEIQALINGST